MYKTEAHMFILLHLFDHLFMLILVICEPPLFSNMVTPSVFQHGQPPLFSNMVYVLYHSDDVIQYNHRSHVCQSSHIVFYIVTYA